MGLKQRGAGSARLACLGGALHACPSLCTRDQKEAVAGEPEGARRGQECNWKRKVVHTTEGGGRVGPT